MLEAKSVPKPGEGFWLWSIKLATGVLIVVLLLVHFIVNHLAQQGLLDYADVIAYYSNPGIVVMEITFLAAVISHTLIGLRGIILDLNPSAKLMSTIDWVLVIAGIGAVVYGISLALVIASRSV
jgi:succinate dehydrogenase / fumarate reductase membrane anchor subunit